ncbi:integrase/recombinase [Mycobacterium riyadhense]|uniref:integrase/recombinase n=1 Tax=Mycobacterium riyadhense TaxID=486698 RepID=UPI00195C3D57|nr:integrase/recombinase [Mycobacterium riyadhense]
MDRVVGAAATELPTQRVREARRRGVPLLLDWLADQPGETWQQRWMASGADAAGQDWAQEPGRWLRRRGNYSENRLELMTSSLLVVVGADVVRPSLAWLLTGGKKRKLVRNMIYGRDRAGFERLRHLCEKDPAIGPYPLGDILFRSAVIVAAKGGTLADITVGDVLEILDAECAVRGRADSGSATFRMLREAACSARTRPRCSRSVVLASVRPPSSSTGIRSRAVRSGICSWPTCRAATGDRLHHPGQSGLSPGAVFLVRRRAAPSRHRLAAVAT